MFFRSETAPTEPSVEKEEGEDSSEISSIKENRQRPKKKSLQKGIKQSGDKKNRLSKKAASNITDTLDNREAVKAVSEDLTAEEQKLHDDIQESMDSEDAAKVRQLCKKITLASKRELREQAVNALGWFDRETMADLTKFLADPDEDIASDALFQWQEALNQIESESQRADIVGNAMSILQDENALEQLSMELNALDEKIAVNTLVGVINGTNPAGVKVGKEAYEFLTGEKYTSPADADKWLQENYTPPEP
jgi:hypothetical protein